MISLMKLSRPPMRLRLLFSLMLAGSPLAGAEDVDAFIEQWIAQQKATRTITAEFVHTRTLPTLRGEQRHPGKLWFQAPAQFRWEMGDPAQMLVLRTGDEVLAIQPRRNSVTRIDLRDETSSRGAEYAMLLRHPMAASAADFRQQFEVQEFSPEDSSVALTLMPRSNEARRSVRGLQLRIERDTGIVSMMKLTLRDGATLRTDFHHVLLNRPVDNSIFEHKATQP